MNATCRNSVRKWKYVVTGMAAVATGANCRFRSDDCVAELHFVETVSNSPIGNTCIQFATAQSLEGRSPEEYLDSHPVYEGTTDSGGNVRVRLPITTSHLLQSATHGVVNPIWIVRLKLAERSETIVFERQSDAHDDSDLLFMNIGDFSPSAGETITVERVAWIGCGSAIPVDRGYLPDP